MNIAFDHFLNGETSLELKNTNKIQIFLCICKVGIISSNLTKATVQYNQMRPYLKLTLNLRRL
jgi:hypothetical protein